MLTRKEYYEIYKKETGRRYSDYVKNFIKFKFKRYTVDWIYASYLSIRFPFLYPRNRFNDRHYVNYTLAKKYTDIYKRASEYCNENINKYIERFGADCTFLNDKYIKSEYVMKGMPFKDRFLYWFYQFLEKVIGIFHSIPFYTEYDAIPRGWKKRFGIQLCKELKEAILKSGGKSYMKGFRILDIKEKWGVLNIYTNGNSPEVNRVIQKYEYISQFVCVSCGEDAVKKTLGWICPYCEKCVPKNQKYVWIDPIYGWSSSERVKKNEELEKEDNIQQ